MARPPSDVAFTPSVKAEQEKRGSRKLYRRVEEGEGWHDRITPDLRTFFAGVRSFYLGTVSSEGRPYIQHRGGPPGFLVALDDKTLG
ncbi:pyridoxamine 5'-phosphate oxidase family protein, partial [Acinetobacter baumannii]